ncbi:MFS transporter [Elongatibacter sediminis]|uniref:MFS transporter n=1 Tax=Elongatibacter sediminis TaxID=3119006 RepID=A0AAW9RHI3_9GAMM
MKSIPFPVWRLTLAYALMMAGTSMTVLIAGIIGTEFAPRPGLATLPIALAVVGIAASTLPTGRLLHRFGRRRIFVAYAALALAAALVVAASLVIDRFALFCAGCFLIGWSAAAGHQYRFAALEAVPAEVAPKATSVLLLGGILGAFIGPELAVRGRNLLPVEYAGSYVLLALNYAVGMLVIAFHRDSAPPSVHHRSQGRPIVEIIREPVVLLAIVSAALGYGVMSFIMTATPISMHTHAGHGLEETKIVIQSHVAGMYLPSLVYAWFQSRLGYRGMLWAGATGLLICIGVALADNAFIHYWAALVILGVGWNFLFLTGTNLLPLGYRPEERFRVQSMNDFLVFSVQAAVSLGSGWFLATWQWNGLLWTCVPLIVVFMLVLAVTPRSVLGRRPPLAEPA